MSDTIMSDLFMITGNSGKFAEVSALIPGIKQLELDLDEIQETDAEIVVRHKLVEAQSKYDGRFIVGDTSLYFNGLNNLPGPLIKWFLKHLGPEGVADLVKEKDSSAVAKTIIGYSNAEKEIYFFEGQISGSIVSPRGGQGFGWDSIFIPEGESETFAQLGIEKKNQLSMRRKAVEKLIEHLKQE